MEKQEIKKPIKKTKKTIWFVLISLLLIVALCGVTVFLTLRKIDTEELSLIEFDNTFSGKVGQTSKTTSTTCQRNVPTTTQNEGLCDRYPTYGTSLSEISDEEKDAIINEGNLLLASSSTYDSMDEEGNLYLAGNPTGRKLYKHTASVGMYYGDVDDNEQAVVQEITIEGSEERNYVTGLYAPAGEVVKIEISSEDLAAIGGEVTIIVGQVSHRNNINNIWKARDDFSRMHIIANKMTIGSTVGYVGNFLGGPIYVYPKNFGTKFTIKISGAVRYFHYIHGVTTREEVEEMKNLSAPYYDFEVWDLGVRHSGPKKYGNFDYDNLVKVGDLWEKICRTSRLVPCSANDTIGVGFVYDCFVAAGAACAFQGGHSWVNAPCSWLAGALDYESMTTNGFWGIIHEFNHLYQSYGMESSKTNEVTNNATSLLSYVLYTNISASRSENDGALSGWNRFTDPSRSLRETLAAAGGDAQSALNCYADLIHSFGVDVFTNAARIQTKFGVDGWYEALSKATGYNMTYYFEELLNQTISSDMKLLYDTPDKTMFVPVACLYQTGRNFFGEDGEQFVETVRPYEIEKGEDLTIDFNQKLIVPSGFSFEIVGVTSPQNGTLVKVSENVYKFTPNANEYSGEMKFEIKLINSSISTKNVTITINLRQRQTNKPVVTRYSYSTSVYSSVDEAIENDFAGFDEKTQTFGDSTFINHIAKNHIGIVEGKIYIPNDGQYVFCLRSGRGNNTLFLSTTGAGDLQQVLSLNTDHPYFSTSGEQVVLLDLKAGDFVYFKEITLSRHAGNDAYTELGWANLTNGESMVTIPSKYIYHVDVEKQEYSFETDEVYAREYSKTFVLSEADITKQSIVSVNHGSWSASEGIENILDANLDTFYHNNRNNFVSDSNPFELVVDLGETVLCNHIKIWGRKSGQLNLPSTFLLYGGLTAEDMTLLGEFVDLSISNNNIEASFDEKEIRYYKLVVTDTKSLSAGNKYVTIAQIDLQYVFSGTEKSPFELDFYKTKSKDFEVVRTPSSFGKVVRGNGVIKYSFEGEGIALFALQNESCKLKITLDGKTETKTISQNADKQLLFFASGLDDKTHNLTIEVVEGNLSIDSFLTK